MLHYHGTPITPREKLYELAGRNFCVSFADPRDVGPAHLIGQSVMLDNGAFTAWTQGRAVDWHAWHDWVLPWLYYPTTWCVLPDSIDGDEAENERLVREWKWTGGAPVWHLHESLYRLNDLCFTFDRVCFGSSRQYRIVGSDAWHRRVTEAFDELARQFDRLPWIHMLRGMSLSGGPYPFASVDSTDIARNHNRNGSPRAMADRWDGRQCPAVWTPRGTQQALEEVA